MGHLRHGDQLMTGLMLQMSAAIGAIVEIADGSVSDLQVAPDTSEAILGFTQSGLVEGTGSSESINETWITPPGAAGAAYQIRATQTLGSVSSGTVNTWLSMDTLRRWTVDQSGIGSTSCILLIEIRRASDSTLLDSASYTLTATVE